jgi:RHS repeat-associated protein
MVGGEKERAGSVNQPGTRFYIAPDHLGAPHQITDASGAAAWLWNHDPFGTGDATGAFGYELRFPGQFFDQSTKLHYNYFRDYDPGTGAYIESDPIGLQGGVNTFADVGGNPINLIDPAGDAGSHPQPPAPQLPAPPVAPGYGTTSCAHYAAQCQANGGLYYCQLAPLVCSNFPNCSWSTCVRQCLQIEDAKYCNHTGHESDVACVVNIHWMCFEECPSGGVPPPVECGRAWL